MNEIVLYNSHLERLRQAVGLLDTVDEAKDLADKAAAAQVWAKRVRLGQDAVNHAAEVRLRAGRRAGQLIPDTVGRGGDRRSNSASTSLKLADLGVTHDQSANWQKLAEIPEPEFDDAIQTLKEEGDVTRAGVMRVHYSSATDEWSTPQALFDLLDSEFDFQLDVCANEGNTKCSTYFSPELDGLAHDWHGVCWMNPPYGTEIGAWVRKAHASGDAGATVVCLVPARVDTGWWWDHCRHGEIRFLRGRLKFGGGDTGAPFPSAVVIFGRPAQTIWWEEWPTA